jgi:hypothetical protein
VFSTEQAVKTLIAVLCLLAQCYCGGEHYLTDYGTYLDTTRMTVVSLYIDPEGRCPFSVVDTRGGAQMLVYVQSSQRFICVKVAVCAVFPTGERAEMT